MNKAYVVSRNTARWSLIECAVEGAAAIGYDAHTTTVGAWKNIPFDETGLIITTGWNPPEHFLALYAHCKEINIPAIAISDGYIKRSADTIPRYGTGYWAVSLNGLNSYTESVFDSFLPSDRWNALDIALKPWQAGDTIVIAHQHRQDWKGEARHAHFDAILKAALATSRPIIVRLHPNHWKQAFVKHFEDYGVRVTQARRHENPIINDLGNAFCLATHDSNAALDAVINGVPAFTIGQTIADPVCSKGFNYDSPSYPDRDAWANWVAYQQWTREEIRTGEPFDYLITQHERINYHEQNAQTDSKVEDDSGVNL